MSTTLEYNRIIYKNTEEDIVIFTNRLGDSNVWDTDNNQRPKEWCLIMVGTEADYWREIGNRLVDVSGGMLQRAVGWSDYQYFSSLSYVKMYRSKLNNAKPLAELFNDFYVECEYRVKHEACLPIWNAGFEKFNISDHGNGYKGLHHLSSIEELKSWLSFFPKTSFTEEFRFTLRITGKSKLKRGRRY